MRRSVFAAILIAVCVLFAAPASAQVQNHDWIANVSVGSSFGTLGSTPVVDASAGYKVTNHLSIVGEFGLLPHAPFDKASVVAPNLAPIATSSDVHVNAYHTNANLFVQTKSFGRFVPYAIVGIGAFTGSTVATGTVAESRLVQYDRDTNLAANVRFGTTYRLARWLGVNADYRHFIVDASATQHVNRFTTGVSLFIK